MLKVVQYQQCTLSVEVTYDLVRIDLTRACAGGHPFSDHGFLEPDTPPAGACPLHAQRSGGKTFLRAHSPTSLPVSRPFVLGTLRLWSDLEMCI